MIRLSGSLCLRSNETLCGGRYEPSRLPAKLQLPPQRFPTSVDNAKQLERQYQHTVDEIFSVLDRRFMTMEKKLCELQDMRDKAAQAWSEHKKSHRSSRHGLPAITPEGKCIC